MKLDVLTNQIYVVALNEARLHNHEYVTPEHFLYGALLFDMGKEIVNGSGGSVDAMINDLQEFFETHIPTHAGDSPMESYSFLLMFELATAQSRGVGKQYITISELLTAIFFLKESFAQYILLKNGMDRLTMLEFLSRNQPEYREAVAEGRPDAREAASDARPDSRPKAAASTLLSQFTLNLCELARGNKLDPLVGREDIITRTVHVLSRRLKNNPIHVGDPGVGKTAIVEGLAQQVVKKNVPGSLLNAQILKLDMGVLLAGTKYRGDFEERLVKLLDEVAKLKNPVLYIDEIHTVVGAGAVSGGGMDATSIIKPYLTRGEIRFIGSTTHEEYKKYFEKDKALARRFQRIDIDEPSIGECVQILKGLRPNYERHHFVSYSDEILSRIAELSARHMNDRFLPDKAIDVMDEAGVAAKLSTNRNRHIVQVTADMVEETVARMAKIPKASLERDEKAVLTRLEDGLNGEVFGQEKAAAMVAYAIKSARSGLNEPERPVASLLFVGPTGVGKTEIARQLAKQLNVKLNRFDMSEYQEKHSVARLIGSPPGYVGYEEGGLLTEAIRKTPHSVLLLDEIEKAHADILNVLLQVMDYGTLTDNNGKKADFSNTVIIMTSNAGAREMAKSVIGFDGRTDAAAVDKAVERIFPPEFRNRLDGIVPFNPVDETMAGLIAVKALNRLTGKLSKQGVTFEPTGEAVEYIAKKGLSAQFGAREIIRVVENDVKRLLVDEVLFGETVSENKVVLDVTDGKFILKR
jgi:ATP-dependent Clp protease ATP-binding subunit ClpA